MSLSMIVLQITLEICRNNNFNVIDLPINLGIGGAVQTGYQFAVKNGYQYAVQVDGDGQHNPEFIRKDASSPSREECEHGDWLSFH